MMQPNGGVAPPPMSQQYQQYQQPPQWSMAPQQQQQWTPQPQQFAPPQALPQVSPQQYAPVQQTPPASSDEIRTLWIGDLQYWMDESYIHSCFPKMARSPLSKLSRNKHTAQPEGYGFIEFVNRAAAERILQTYNGALMPNVEQTFRLNWAFYGSGERRPDDGVDHTVFVGDLASDVTDYVLQETFRSHYSSVKGAKVVMDRITGRSKGYGFVRFGDESEQLRAMTEMNGVFCSTRPMRVGPAAAKKNAGAQQQYSVTASYDTTQATQVDNSDPSNTTIFVGGLDSNVTDEHLRQVFGQYGELLHVKIPVGKRCGFVQFASRACAEEALLMLNGTQLGGQSVRLSWGRNPSNKQVQPQPDPNQSYGSYYGYGQGYESYGYAQPSQDPNMYAYGAYPDYGNYQHQQPQQ